MATATTVFSVVSRQSFAVCVGVWFSFPPRIGGGFLTCVGLFVGGMPYSVAVVGAIPYSLLRCSQGGSFFPRQLLWRVRGPPISKAKDPVQQRVYYVDGQVSCPLLVVYIVVGFLCPFFCYFALLTSFCMGVFFPLLLALL